ncbi:MAG: response regulator [Pseudomonadales bacterium]|nr:response regulator [Pseudomonadales bacterium]
MRALINAIAARLSQIFRSRQDFTESNKASAAITRQLHLADRNQLFQLLVQNTSDLIFITDLNLNYLYCSPSAAKITGYDATELQDRSIFHNLYKDNSASGQRSELIHRLGIYRSDVDYDATLEKELHFTRPNGESYWLEIRFSYFRAPNGTVLGIAGSGRDISERKQAEELSREVSVQLRRAQKIDSIGQIAGGIAHDFNNMLIAIQGYSELAASEANGLHPLDSYLNEIIRASDRAKALTTQLLSFSRNQIRESKPFFIDKLIQGLQSLIVPLIPTTITLQTSLKAASFGIVGDPRQIEQVIVNLCLNARDSMQRGGTLTISTSSVILDESDLTDSDCRPGSYIRLTVSDTGTGIDHALADKIYEPFFSTKSESQGTGLGLSIVRGIIEDHGGFICLDTAPGSGTRFHLYIPANPMLSCYGQDETDTQLATGGSETLLVVEDEPQVREFTALALRKAGYTVITAIDGQQGWETFMDHRQEISLILSDIMMAKIDGAQLLKMIRTVDPHLPVILMSGYAGSQSPAKLLQEDGSYFLPKPFSSNELLRKIRDSLDTTQAQVSRRQRSVLAVDDDESMLQLLQLDIEELGHRVIVTTDADRALHYCQEHHFDLILIDLNMKPVSGVGLTRQINSLAGSQGPIIGLTGYLNSQDEIVCLQAGMEKVLVKPLAFNTLAGLLGGDISGPAPAADPAVNHSVFDALHALRIVNGKAEIAGQLLSILMGKLDQDIGRITESFRQGDMKELKFQVHKLNGASKYCGVPALTQVLQHLEEEISMDSNDVCAEAIAGWMDRLQTEVTRLQQFYAENPAPFSVSTPQEIASEA